MPGIGYKLSLRYFFGRKSAQAINIISWISVSAIIIATAAMIILLSVENGFDGLLKDLYKVFYPQLKISAQEGKWFHITDAQKLQLLQIKGIHNLALSIEDNVMLSANDEQRFATIKGIDSSWMRQSGMDSFILDGNKQLDFGAEGYAPAIAGVNIAAVMGINVTNPFSEMRAYYPKLNAHYNLLNPDDALNSMVLKPQAEFKVQADFDGKYILIPLQIAQRFLGAEGQVSAVEIQLIDNASEREVVKGIKKILGNKVLVQDQYEQNKTLWMIMKSEKWAIYIILLFVLLLSSFNMVGALSMLVIEKRNDITILKSMGATEKSIRNIFMGEGVVMALIGGLSGVLIGVAVCLGQEHFGWIKLGEGAFIIDAYPVRVQASDVLIVILTAFVVGLLASLQPSYKAARQAIHLRED